MNNIESIDLVIIILIIIIIIILLISFFLKRDVKKLKIGPFEVEKFEYLFNKGNETIDNFNNLTIILAKAKILELEIFKKSGGIFMNDDEQIKMDNYKNDLKSIVSEIDKILKN